MNKDKAKTIIYLSILALIPAAIFIYDSHILLVVLMAALVSYMCKKTLLSVIKIRDEKQKENDVNADPAEITDDLLYEKIRKIEIDIEYIKVSIWIFIIGNFILSVI